MGSFLVCSYWGGTDCLPRSLLHHTRHRQVINIISSKDILGGTKEQMGPKHNGQKVLFAVMGPNFILIIGTDSIFTSNHKLKIIHMFWVTIFVYSGNWLLIYNVYVYSILESASAYSTAKAINHSNTYTHTRIPSNHHTILPG